VWRSSGSSGVATTAMRLDVGLTTSIGPSAMMTAVIIHHSSLGQAKMLPPQQSSSGRCPNHQPWRDGQPARSCAPTTVADATEVVRSYEGSQYYARQTHLLAQALQTIPITWPFTVWGLDLVGLFQKAPGGFTHLLVTIDKFSKWIEAWPITQIKSE
jgi:hypothetical protein